MPTPESPARPLADSPARAYGVQVLDRAFAILDLLEDRPARPAEIGAALGLHRSTVFRLLANLERRGYVHKNEQDGTYGLGLRLYELGMRAVGDELPLRRLRPLLEHLAVTTGNTAQLWVRSGHEAVCVDQVESPRDERLVGRLGRRLPLDRGAVGKVLLAFAPPGVLDSFLAASLAANAPSPQTQMVELRDELERIAAQGWALSAAEFHSSASAVAAPVRGPFGRVEAALCVLTLDADPDPAQLARERSAVLEAAGAMSSLLGHLAETPGSAHGGQWYNGSGPTVRRR